MFKILEVLHNILSAFYVAGWMFIVSLFTGKMPKVSVYHFEKYSDSTLFDVTSDKYIKTDRPDLVTDECKKRIIEEYIDQIKTDPVFYEKCKDLNFKVINENLHKDYSIYQMLHKIKNDYIN